jgi:hypothetical protein
MNRVENIEEEYLLTDEEVAEYEQKSGNIVVRVGTILKLDDKRIATHTKNISGTYTVIDCDVDTFSVKDHSGTYYDLLWWDVSGHNPRIVIEKIKY